ncbi:MAG TPA: pitrilysin family protein [Bryobacteraceae bacterium]|nr:pitrilysin family protein [Bryobacteraceae bacterium]
MKRNVAFFLAFAGLLLAQQTGSRMPPLKFTDTTLDNGLRVIILEDHFAPLYALAICYKVGSRDERQGRTGFAHLFEHMMFKGSENVGAGEHFYDIFTKGGGANGNTNTDRTMYYEVLPKNQLDLGLYLEADRMRSLAITKENLDNQRQAVKEERRQGIDNQPYGPTSEKVDGLIYDNFAYQHSVIGSMADLDAATVEDVQQFFKTYYAPNNAVLALAGDVDAKDTLARVKKYFGGIPRQPAPKPVDLTEPEKPGERRGRLEDRLARVTRVEIDYRVPEITNPQTRALIVAAPILGGGESSRLYQKLVKEKETAIQVACIVDGRDGPSTLRIVAYLRPGKTSQEAEGVISEEIAKLNAEPVSEKELERVRTTIRRGIPAVRESMLNSATALAEDAALYNDPNRINSEPDQRIAVTAADIQKAAQAWLRTPNRVVMITDPPPPPPMPSRKQQD